MKRLDATHFIEAVYMGEFSGVYNTPVYPLSQVEDNAKSTIQVGFKTVAIFKIKYK